MKCVVAYYESYVKEIAPQSFLYDKEYIHIIGGSIILQPQS